MTVAGGVVGVVGGAGAVGSAALRQLHAWGVRPLRVGARDPARASAVVDEACAGAAAVVAVDITDPDALAAFCAGCAVVLNCAGPAVELRDRVAVAALAAGASTVDASGDDGLHAALRARSPGHERLAAVVSAGLMPGLSGLLPRYLAEIAPAEGARLTGYVGGRDRFTTTAALDYLAADGYGEPLAAWRAGGRRSRALPPLTNVALPYFPEPVTAQPYLSTETERLARRFGVAEVDWYSVFAGDRVLAVLRAGSGDRVSTAGRLCRAAELDLFGLRPYQMVVILLGDAALVLRGVGASALTGATAALAARAVWAGEVPAGVHHAAEVLDAATSVSRLRECSAVEELNVLNGVSRECIEIEEGAL